MVPRFPILRRWASLGLVAGLCILGCRKPEVGKGPSPEKPRVEADLSKTTISAKAAQSLGIQTEAVRIERVQEQVQRTGWIIPRQGNDVTLTAPVAGTVREAQAVPRPGQVVAKGSVVFRLEPVLSPLEEIQLASLKRGLENELAKAKENVVVSQSELERIAELHKQKLRGQQDVEQAQAKLKNAREDVAAALDKQKLFAGFGSAKSPAPVDVAAPDSGTVVAVPVSPGQFVPAGAPLATLVNLDRLWVRVPVAEHDLPRIDRKQTIIIRVPQAPTREKPAGMLFLNAQPVGLVPQVDAARHTADMLYEIEGAPAGILAKDQMVTALLSLGAETVGTIVPDSALIFDAFGGTWVYLDQTAPKAEVHTYERRRIELGAPLDRGLLLVRPPFKAGERVVSSGAAALFSREFHKPPVADAP